MPRGSCAAFVAVADIPTPLVAVTVIPIPLIAVAAFTGFFLPKSRGKISALPAFLLASAPTWRPLGVVATVVAIVVAIPSVAVVPVPVSVLLPVLVAVAAIGGPSRLPALALMGFVAGDRGGR